MLSPSAQQGNDGQEQMGLIVALNRLLLGPQHWCTAHMSSSDGILLSRLPHSTSFIIVDNDSTIPTSYHGAATLLAADTSFHLNNVLVAPAIVPDLSVR